MGCIEEHLQEALENAETRAEERHIRSALQHVVIREVEGCE